MPEANCSCGAKYGRMVEAKDTGSLDLRAFLVHKSPAYDAAKESIRSGLLSHAEEVKKSKGADAMKTHKAKVNYEWEDVETKTLDVWNNVLRVTSFINGW